MELTRSKTHLGGNRSAEPARGFGAKHWARAVVCFWMAAVFTGTAHSWQVPGQQPPSMNPDRPYLLPDANRLPNVNDQMVMRENKVIKQNFDAANAERKKQMAKESAQLLTLAMALKAEVDNTGKNPLSPNAVRKAEEIQRLAHDLKQMMVITVGTN